MTKKNYHKKPASQVKIAAKRINFLFSEAKASFRKDTALANRHVKTALRIAMKYKVKLPASLKKKFCKNCRSYLVPGVNSRVRIHKHRVIYYCFSCRHYMRHQVN